MAVLIYRAGLKYSVDPVDPSHRPELNPTRDTRNLGPLHLMQSPTLPGVPFDKLTAEPGGLRFTVTRTDAPETGPSCDQKDNCYVGAVVYPFPQDINAFKIRVTFERPRWENIDPVDYQWAMVAFVRNGRPDYQPKRSERTTVTLNLRDTNGALAGRMNTPCGPPPGTPYPYPGDPGRGPAPIPESAHSAILGWQSKPTLELLVDRDGERAKATLDVEATSADGASYSETRWFIHPLITGDTKGPVESVGFAIAIGDALGTASVTITDFRIYRLNRVDLWWARFGEWIGGLFG